MPRPADPGWLRFQEILQRDQRRNAELAHDLGISPQQLSHWKTARSRPAFAELPAISAVVAGGDPTYLAVEMGLIPAEPELRRRLVSAYVAVQRLEKRQVEVAETLRTTPSSGASAVIAKAISTGRWAAAVWPAHEGPPGCRLHVADRLDFTRIDRTAATEAGLRTDIGDLLDSLHAVRTVGNWPRPRFAHQPDPDRSYEHWSIYRLHADRPPHKHALRSLTMTSIGVTSLSIRSWASDTAAVIAKLLGWGLMSTRSLAATRTLADLDEVRSARRDTLIDLLTDPPRQHVWYHFGRLSPEGTGHLPAAIWPQGLVIVRLRESDAMLDTASEGNAEFHKTLLRDRDRLDEESASGVSTQMITIEVDNAEDRNDLLSAESRRDLKMTRAIEVAGKVLSRAHAQQWLLRPSIDNLHSKIDDEERRLILGHLAKTNYKD